MNIGSLFKDLHGAIQKEKLIPLRSIAGKRKDVPSKKTFDEAIQYLEIDPAYVFLDSDSYINRIIYWKGPVFASLYNLDLQVLKSMRAKEMIEQITKNFDNLLAAKDYEAVFRYMDKKLIIPNFIDMYDEIPDDQKYEIFVDLHVRSEYGFEMFPANLLKDVFSKRTQSPEWKKRMKQLKKDAKFNAQEKIIIYRGDTREPIDKYPWTLDKKIAEFFANRFGSKGKIYQREVSEKDILDYFPQRGEKEVIVFI